MTALLAHQPLEGHYSTGGRAHLLVVPDIAGFTELRIWSESFEDAQRARIACENRMLRGGVAPELFAGQIAALKAAEHQIKLGMVRSYRRVVPPGVREWQQGAFGIGEHLLARLLGTLGHPRIATPYHWEGEPRELIADQPFERTVRQLWSYCGHGDAARKKRKGMTAEDAFALGSPRCKMLVHLLAEATIKCRVEPSLGSNAEAGPVDPTSSPDPPERATPATVGPAGQEPSTEPMPQASALPDPAPCSADQPIPESEAAPTAVGRHYRSVYDTARANYADREDWTLGHKHNSALRLVGKEVLRDLWRAAG